ncbi:hypothetical protein E5673_08200 [Sphingomonas sp. PAMC26645]|uniref:hypothetical protein n=1 Tax=Sphingomonas sp. PAMC26645 TaxID=2565555 RepID=UPI00109DF035|nr:hypothetical protein [Sphingomonas sp. PAMC26645]QCB42214.1 hypothetical protein E5673_08200 [Sphingomonas sp. PAMC26645]
MGDVDESAKALLADLQRGREALVDRQHLRHGNGGGTSGGVTDDWKASVDAQLKHLREDVQQVRNWIVVGVAGPLLAVIGLYVYTGTKFDAVSAKFDIVETRIVGVESKVNVLAVEQAKTNAKLDLLLERSARKTR